MKETITVDQLYASFKIIQQGVSQKMMIVAIFRTIGNLWLIEEPWHNEGCWDQRNRGAWGVLLIRLFKALESSRNAYFCRKHLIENSKKWFLSRFLWHGILTLYHFSANAGKVMPWTQTTMVLLTMILKQLLLILQISALKGNLLRLHVPGLLFSVSTLSGCLNFFYQPHSEPFQPFC